MPGSLPRPCTPIAAAQRSVWLQIGRVTYLPEVVNLAELLALPELPSDLERVESALHDSVRTADVFLTDVARHLFGGGKRIRPALCVAAARAGGAGASDGVVLGGVSCELVHLGSLYHDDVIDEAATRRSVETVNARWGNLVAILAGDFLLAKASEIAAGLGTEVAGLLASTIGRLCEGEILELRSAFDTTRTTDDYLRSIEGKTASLMATSCRIGAIVAGLPREHVDALTSFGLAVGMVFQIRDDVLDLTATDDELGKPSGQDLVEGVYTLPVLHALTESECGPELRDMLGRPLDGPERDKVRELVRSSGGVEAAVAVASGYAVSAEVALAALPRNGAVDGLAALGRHLLAGLAP